MNIHNVNKKHLRMSLFQNIYTCLIHIINSDRQLLAEDFYKTSARLLEGLTFNQFNFCFDEKKFFSTSYSGKKKSADENLRNGLTGSEKIVTGSIQQESSGEKPFSGLK